MQLVSTERIKKSSWGPLHTRHFCSRYCDIAIKRYFDKKIKRHFSSNIFFLRVLKIFFWDNSKYFEMSLQYFEETNIFLSKCLFIFLSKYCVQKCLVCISPKVDNSYTKNIWTYNVCLGCDANFRKLFNHHSKTT